MRGVASDAWPAVAAAAIPTLVSSRPSRRSSADERRRCRRMRRRLPHADVRPIDGMRHAVLASAPSAGTLVADWLRRTAHRGRRLTPGTIA